MVVGDPVGCCVVGLMVVGAELGCPLITVGSSVGMDVGSSVGITVGLSVGATVGWHLGNMVGDGVVGLRVVGTPLGANVVGVLEVGARVNVGLAVGSQC